MDPSPAPNRDFIHQDREVREAITRTAQTLVNSTKVNASDRVLVFTDAPGNVIADQAFELAQSRGAEVRMFVRDLALDAASLRSASPEDVPRYFDRERELMGWATKAILIGGPEDPTVIGQLPSEVKAAYDQERSQIHQPRMTGELPWVLTAWPTPYDAAQEGMSYRDYFRVVVEAGSQPWEEIHAAQEILIARLDAGKTLQLIANPLDPDTRARTDITLSIEGMTFCNSVVQRNVPGSEVFSAPVRDSVHGQLWAPGKWLYAGREIEDIRYEIKDGRIVLAEARIGQEGLNEILSMGEGARYFGEVALGTNPGLRRRLIHPLFCEKTGGSFHLAVGKCYSHTEYDGKAVHLNNGNHDTSVHWDMTILMHPAAGGGRVVLDGEVIQEDGRFVDPALKVLVPHHLR